MFVFFTYRLWRMRECGVMASTINDYTKSVKKIIDLGLRFFREADPTFPKTGNVVESMKRTSAIVGEYNKSLTTEIKQSQWSRKIQEADALPQMAVVKAAVSVLKNRLPDQIAALEKAFQCVPRHQSVTIATSAGKGKVCMCVLCLIPLLTWLVSR